jgi:hypothetical protein
MGSNLPQDKTKLANNLLSIYLRSKKEFIEGKIDEVSTKIPDNHQLEGI